VSFNLAELAVYRAHIVIESLVDLVFMLTSAGVSVLIAAFSVIVLRYFTD
jgi:hypothetical protein